MYDGGQCDNKVFKEFIIKQYSKRVKSNGIQWGDSIGIWHSKNVSNYFHDKMVCNLRGYGGTEIDQQISRLVSKRIHNICKKTIIYLQFLNIDNTCINNIHLSQAWEKLADFSYPFCIALKVFKIIQLINCIGRYKYNYHIFRRNNVNFA